MANLMSEKKPLNSVKNGLNHKYAKVDISSGHLAGLATLRECNLVGNLFF